ncbi:MAG: hypothetical protein HRT47_12150 [Candidatus Caenarcaniphilales bacterium]|nr:hypothetical protein [Candidatus Caenarcaniphilales bacterium]
MPQDNFTTGFLLMQNKAYEQRALFNEQVKKTESREYILREGPPLIQEWLEHNHLQSLSQEHVPALIKFITSPKALGKRASEEGPVDSLGRTIAAVPYNPDRSALNLLISSFLESKNNNISALNADIKKISEPVPVISNKVEKKELEISLAKEPLQKSALKFTGKLIEKIPQENETNNGSFPDYIIAGSLASLLLSQAHEIEYPDGKKVTLDNEARDILKPVIRKIKDFDCVILNSDCNFDPIYQAKRGGLQDPELFKDESGYFPFDDVKNLSFTDTPPPPQKKDPMSELWDQLGWTPAPPPPSEPIEKNYKRFYMMNEKKHGYVKVTLDNNKEAYIRSPESMLIYKAVVIMERANDYQDLFSPKPHIVKDMEKNVKDFRALKNFLEEGLGMTDEQIFEAFARELNHFHRLDDEKHPFNIQKGFTTIWGHFRSINYEGSLIPGDVKDFFEKFRRSDQLKLLAKDATARMNKGYEDGYQKEERRERESWRYRATYLTHNGEQVNRVTHPELFNKYNRLPYQDYNTLWDKFFKGHGR